MCPDTVLHDIEKQVEGFLFMTLNMRRQSCWQLCQPDTKLYWWWLFQVINVLPKLKIFLTLCC